MLRTRSVGLAFVLAVVIALLHVHAVCAQAPARAPVVVEDAEEAAKEARRATAQQRGRAMVVDPRTMGRGSQPVMLIEGEFIYVLIGTTLLQLTADGLELQSKVDLRPFLMPEKKVREPGERGLKRGAAGRNPERPITRRADKPAKPAAGAEGDAPAEEEGDPKPDG